MKQRINNHFEKLLSGLMILTLVLGMFPLTAAAEGAESQVHIMAYAYGESGHALVYPTDTHEGMERLAGASYDLAANTLTLTNVKTTMGLSISGVANNFKIQLNGENELGGISLYQWQDGVPCYMELTGTGSLTINTQNTSNDVGFSSGALIDLYAESGTGTFKVDKGVKLTLYAREGNSVIRITHVKAQENQVIVFEQEPTTAYKIESTQWEDKTYKQFSGSVCYEDSQGKEYHCVSANDAADDDTVYVAEEVYGKYYIKKAIYSDKLHTYCLQDIENIDEYGTATSLDDLGFTWKGDETIEALDSTTINSAVYRNNSGRECIYQDTLGSNNEYVMECFEITSDSDIPGVTFLKSTGTTISYSDYYNLEPIVVSAQKIDFYDYEIKASSLVISDAVQQPAQDDKKTETKEAENLPSVGTKESDKSGAADYKVTSTKGGDVEVTYVATKKKSAKTVTIPATVTLADGTKAKVTAVANGAFKNSKTVTTVTVGSNVETIGTGAFQGAKMLKKVTLGKKVTSIGNNAFKNCTSLTTVKVSGNNVKTIGTSAFQGDSKLKSASIGKNVTSIGKNAFNGCKSMKTVTITSTKVKSIGKNAFKGISTKATIKVPKSKYSNYKKKLKSAGVSSKVKIKKS